MPRLHFLRPLSGALMALLCAACTGQAPAQQASEPQKVMYPDGVMH